MPRRITDAAARDIAREHSETTDLFYMRLREEEVFLAIDSVQPVLFQRPDDGVEREWKPVGGAVVPGSAEETPDLDSHGMDIQFIAIDESKDFLSRFLTQNLFNKKFEWWRLHWEEEGSSAGNIRSFYNVAAGYMNGRFDIEDVVPNDPNTEPGNILVRFRVMSPLAMMDFAKNIKTNLQSHQRWYPGDRGMEYVGSMENLLMYWGIQHPQHGNLPR